MIDAFVAKYTDISREGAEGVLADWEAGRGEIDAELVNGNPLFEELAISYSKAHGVEVPESVKIPLTPVDEKLLETKTTPE